MKTKFDEIFVIHLADNKERMLNIDEQFLKLEINPTIYYTTKRPFSNKIANVFRPQIETDYYNNVEKYNKKDKKKIEKPVLQNGSIVFCKGHDGAGYFMELCMKMEY